MQPQPATPENIEKAAQILRSGGLVAFPTETVYGLGADATNGVAVARIFEAKGRPRFNPLIVHVASVDAARSYAALDERALLLAGRFWPGPLTLVVPLRPQSGLSELVTCGLPSVGLRVPSQDTAQALLREAGVPIAAPSANRSGHVSPTCADHVAADLGSQVDFILDGGPCRAGVESTIVGLTGERAVLYRPGALAREDIEAVLGEGLEAPPSRTAAPTSPGQLASHYAPRAKIRLNASGAEPGETLLAFGPDAPQTALNLSRSGDLREAAANLFAYLRKLDGEGAATIAVMPIPQTGLGEAINDRLARAAAPRPVHRAASSA